MATRTDRVNDKQSEQMISDIFQIYIHMQISNTTKLYIHPISIVSLSFVLDNWIVCLMTQKCQQPISDGKQNKKIIWTCGYKF